MLTEIKPLSKCLLVTALWWLLAIAAPASASDIIVNSTADIVPPVVDGDCTLREALWVVYSKEAVKDCSGTGHRIRFELPAHAEIILQHPLEIIVTKTEIISDKPLTIRRDPTAKPFRIFHIMPLTGVLGDTDRVPVEMLLDGLTIANGYAKLPKPLAEYSDLKSIYELGGGGILNQGHLTLKNCIITDNYAESVGGGISNVDSYVYSTHYAKLFIYNTIIANNKSPFTGGGIYNKGSQLWLENSVVFNNQLENKGYIDSLKGAGIVNRDISSRATLVNSVISHNTILDDTGISSTKLGAGFYANKNAHSLIINSTIVNNTINDNRLIPIVGGAGIFQDEFAGESPGSFELYNSLVAANYAILRGKPVPGNNTAEVSPIQKQNNGIIDIKPEDLTSLVTITPTAYAPHYQPIANSSLINAGDNAHLDKILSTPQQDIAGNLRVSDGIVDIGAYEYQFPRPVNPFPTPRLSLHIAAKGQGAVTVTSNNRERTCRSACNYGYAVETYVSLAAKAAEGYLFTGWSNPKCAEERWLLDTTTHCIASFERNLVQYASSPAPNSTLQFTSAYGNLTTQHLTIQNRQTGSLTVELLGLNGPQAHAFNLPSDAFPLTLSDRATTQVALGCQPNQPEPATAHLDLRTNDSQRPTVTYYLKCNANNTAVTPPVPAPSPTPPSLITAPPLYSSQPLPATELHFMSQIGQPTTQALRLINLGEGELRIEAASIHDDSAGVFTILNADWPLTVAGLTAESNPPEELVIQCLPLAINTDKATLTLRSNDPNQANHSYPLICQGRSMLAEQRQLTLNRVGMGTLYADTEWCQTTSCHYTLPASTQVKLAAAPAPGWQFQSWQCSGVSATSANILTVPLEHNIICSAVFEMKQKLQVIVSATGQGHIRSSHPLLAVDCSDNCSYDITPEVNGQTVSLDITPNSGWLFTGWQGSCADKSVIQLRELNNCAVEFAEQRIYPRPEQARVYQTFNSNLGYQLTVEVDNACVSESLNLDYAALWEEMRTTEVHLNRFNNLCVATLAADTDGDSIIDQLEQAAPNGGDANYDGIADFQQGHVVSARHPNLGYFSFETVPGCEMTNFVLNPEEVWSALGIVDFAMPATCPQTDIRMVFHDVKTSRYAESQDYLNEFKFLLDRLFLSGHRGGRYYHTPPYAQTFIRAGNIVTDAEGVPLLEVFGHIQTTPWPHLPNVTLRVEDALYLFEEAQQTYEIKVRLMGEIDEPLTVYYGDVSAITRSELQDYTLTPSKLTWYPDQTRTQTFTLTTEDDNIIEEYSDIVLYFGKASRPNVLFKPDQIVNMYFIDIDVYPPCTPAELQEYIKASLTNTAHDFVVCDMQNQTIITSDISTIKDNDTFYLSNVVITDSGEDEWLHLRNTEIFYTTFKTKVYGREVGFSGTLENYTVFYRNVDLEGGWLTYVHFANDRDEPNIVVSRHSHISHAIIDSNVELRGGVLGGIIINRGQINSVEFIGDVLSGGKLAGMLTLGDDSLMQDVTFYTLNNGIRTSVLGGRLGGRIDGDPYLPAKLSHLTIVPNTHLSNVILSEGIQFAGPLTLSGLIQGDPHYAPLRLDHVHITADTHLNHVMLGQNVTVENGVLFGDNVRIAPDANIGCRNATRMTPDYQVTPTDACFFNHFASPVIGSARTPSRPAHLYMTLLVDPRDSPQAADLIVVAVVQEPTGAIAYMRDGDDWLAWDGELTSLTALTTIKALRRDYKISLYRGDLNTFDGEFTLYAGYRLANGDIVYNGVSPLAFTLSTPQAMQFSSLRDTVTHSSDELPHSFFTSFIRRHAEVSKTRENESMTHIRQHMHIDVEHWQQAGELLAVLGTTADEWYMLDSEHRWRPWNGDFNHLTAVYHYPQLPEQVQLSLTVPETGTRWVYVGYRLTTFAAEGHRDDTLIFNGGYPVQLEHTGAR